MRKEKGLFGRLGLKASGQYVFPSPQRRWMMAGLLLALLAFSLMAADAVFRGGSLLSSGPLSPNHALLKDDCSACHDLGGVSNQNCSSCHEKFSAAMPIYTLQAHYIYRSQDLSRTGDPSLALDCADCHPEHRGAGFAPTQVGDQRCLKCHPGDSFQSGHPQFDHIAEQAVDPAGLKFNHARHTKAFAERFQLEGEQACLYCHELEPSGMHFEALDFDRHCGSACHLNRGTEPLPLNGSQPGLPGVLTLQQLQSLEPSQPCLDSVATGDFTSAGSGSLAKRRLRHKDCWIIENLRLLRRSISPDLGWRGLLAVDGSAVGSEDCVLAAEHLEQRLAELRRQGDSTIGPLEAELEQAKRLARRPGIPARGQSDPPSAEAVSQVELILSNAYQTLARAGAISEAAPVSGGAQAVSDLISRLTQPCRECHFTSEKGFAPVQSDQRVLRRAEFDHGAHVVQMECLSCHQRLIENEFVGLDGYDERTSRLSAMLNLPAIEDCRRCHHSGGASAECVSCHVFHPEKQRRMERLLIQPERERGS